MPRHSGIPVVRFAPSPNGYLHLGHAYSALKNFEFAQRHGGRFLLRVEDIDIARSKQEFVDAIYDDLHWLGISWEEPVRRQSEHLQDYADGLQQLAVRGLLYRCTCSRGDIRAAIGDNPAWPADPDGSPLYPGTCRGNCADAVRDVGPGEKDFALRLDMFKVAGLALPDLAWSECDNTGKTKNVPAEFTAWGDIVLARRDIGTSYHVAVVVDDALQGITDVIRGTDLYAATAVHRVLQCLLDLPAPVYRHHPLILDQDGKKLAKSAVAKPIRQWRAEGANASGLRSMLGFEEM